MCRFNWCFISSIDEFSVSLRSHFIQPRRVKMEKIDGSERVIKQKDKVNLVKDYGWILGIIECICSAKVAALMRIQIDLFLSIKKQIQFLTLSLRFASSRSSRRCLFESNHNRHWHDRKYQDILVAHSHVHNWRCQRQSIDLAHRLFAGIIPRHYPLGKNLSKSRAHRHISVVDCWSIHSAMNMHPSLSNWLDGVHQSPNPMTLRHVFCPNQRPTVNLVPPSVYSIAPDMQAGPMKKRMRPVSWVWLEPHHCQWWSRCNQNEEPTLLLLWNSSLRIVYARQERFDTRSGRDYPQSNVPPSKHADHRSMFLHKYEMYSIE